MKKTLALILVLLLIVALSACKAQENNKSANALPKVNPSNSADTQASASDGTKTVDTPTPNTNTNNVIPEPITRERAVELALEKAGLDRNAVFDIEAELDREREGVLWEVDFETREHEYSYDINAYDGTVVKSDRERNH